MKLVAVWWLLAAYAFRSSTGNETESDEPVDAIRAIGALPQLLLLAATVDVPMFECLTADLPAYYPSAGTATYVWHVKGHGGQPGQDIIVDYTIKEGTIDRAVAYMNSDTSNPIPAQAVYSDYKTCLVNKMSLGSQELCLQWVTPGTENGVPEACNAAFKEKCGGGPVLYKDDECK